MDDTVEVRVYILCIFMYEFCFLTALIFIPTWGRFLI